MTKIVPKIGQVPIDIFTKPLPREAFEYFLQRLAIISTPK
jgi:hypothetical protein